jgi:arginase
VLDFGDMPLAENTSEHRSPVRSTHVGAAPLLAAPNLAVLTVCELNPDHGESDGSTLVTFARALAEALALSPSL